MDLISSNLQATNEKFNSILSKLEEERDLALANLETAAATLTPQLESKLGEVTSNLRSLVPEGFSVPNVNLQGQLQSLSGLTDLTQSANLLASITADFDDALSSSGFSLDTLVSSAKSAFDSGDTLSGVVPNFEKSPLGDVFQKANAVKLPDINPVVEKVATFVSNTSLTTAQTSASAAVLPTSEELPTKDEGKFKVTEESEKITQSSGGQSITKEVTTPEKAIEKTSEPRAASVKRKNISPKGFSNRKRVEIEKFTDVDNIVLTYKPIYLIAVYGYTDSEDKREGKGRFLITKTVNSDGYGSLPGGRTLRYKGDTYSISGTKVTVNQKVRKYVRVEISYFTNGLFDPSVK